MTHVRILGRPCHAMRLAAQLATAGVNITGTHRRHDAHDGHGPRPTTPVPDKDRHRIKRPMLTGAPESIQGLLRDLREALA